MGAAERKFLPGHNYYVPAMQAAADLGQMLHGRVSLGKPVVADADGILDGTSTATAIDTTTFAATYAATDAIMGKYGRNVTIVLSGAGTPAVTVYGRDYLGQKMRETLTGNGTTPVLGLKAFKYIDRITAAVLAAETIDVGFGTKLGLPYVTTKIEEEWIDNVVGAAGTLAAPVFTDPQTATTGDPRGTYIPTTAPNGSRLIEVDCEFNNYVNASSNGGMHGIKHYNG